MMAEAVAVMQGGRGSEGLETSGGSHAILSLKALCYVHNTL